MKNVALRFGNTSVEATSHSTIFDIPMRPLCEDQKQPTSFYPLKKTRNFRDGNYSFEFRQSSGEK